MDSLTLIKNFVRDKKVATITPSSKSLTKKICHQINFSNTCNILEYGPGTGPITKALLKQMDKKSKVIAIERNKNLFNSLRKIKDKRLTVLNEDARRVSLALDRKNLPKKFDYVISGIPLSMMQPAQKQDLIKNTSLLLSSGGKFIVYQTTPRARKYLRHEFRKTTLSFMPINLPPMFVMTASKI